MWIRGVWMTETEADAYVEDLETKLKARDIEADNGARQIALYDDECRRLKKILELARSEVHRPYPEYQYRWEHELDKMLTNESSVFHEKKKEGTYGENSSN